MAHDAPSPPPADGAHDPPLEVVVRLPPGPEPRADRDGERLRGAAARALGVPPDALGAVRTRRVSFDARRRQRDWRVVLDVWRRGETPAPGPATTPAPIAPPPAGAPHVVVVGSGPAGLFAALELLRGGVRVTVLERGGDVRQRRRPLAALNRGQPAGAESNYCFGEGGAGTYSDGKLYARSGSKRAVRAVLAELVAHGASPTILSSWRPHIGSNRLPAVVAALRESIRAGGGAVRFEARVTAVAVDRTGAAPRAVGVEFVGTAPGAAGRPERIAADAVVLATGHSARDALELAARAGARLEAKGFALGVRAEHPQPFVDEHQYGGLRARHELPAAFYELVAQSEGRGVYSFCMCPGGWIVPATTAPDRVVVNGMSLARRDSPFASSGLVVALEPEDWCGARAVEWGLRERLPELPPPPAHPDDDPLYGVRLQEALERRACVLGGGRNRAPAQRIDAFVEGDAAPPALPTSYRPGLAPLRLDELLPRGLAERLRAGLREFDRRIPGFVSDFGQLVAPESRTSSPVRIARDRESGEALGVDGLYPAGEGAGFAGGIVSAAIDGQRAARHAVARVLG